MLQRRNKRFLFPSVANNVAIAATRTRLSIQTGAFSLPKWQVIYRNLKA